MNDAEVFSYLRQSLGDLLGAQAFSPEKNDYRCDLSHNEVRTRLARNKEAVTLMSNYSK